MDPEMGPGSSDVFDVQKIRSFVELMNEHELTEIDLRQGDQRIRLRRGPEPFTTAGVAAALSERPLPPPPAEAHSAAPAGEPGTSATSASEADAVYIKSPMVGTFYTAASPDASPFVSMGDQVGPESTVCIVEAMKVFNEIPAECSGKILACLVENGESVEFGQPLFKVQTAA